TLFFEPSTRTRLSFEAAMYELGGHVLSVPSGNSSSAAKGESVADTAKTVSCYADIIAMRHPKEGAALVAAKNATVPVINAGDGGHCHPTQTLADLLTIYRAKGRFSDLTVGFCGDLKYGRTVHSLINALARYKGVRLVLIAPPELALPEYVKDRALAAGMTISEARCLDEALPELDVLYMTRIQRERFGTADGYAELEDSFRLTKKKLETAKKDLCILHPLPRVDEIEQAVDADPRAQYFEQVKNGKVMRKALILFLLERIDCDPETTDEVVEMPRLSCRNERCITHAEPAAHLFKKWPDGHLTCLYCDGEEIR
ncbi:MAG: aspartate carbamoyltransferase, partial [Clostridia bacterium]|nr:aspartate carbamoyltransferase [Clostridia bacterium]